MITIHKSQFTVVVWVMSVICLPILAYIGAMIANTTGLPLEPGYVSYDATSGLYMGLMLGIPFATMVTVLSACHCLREGKGFNLWAAGVSVLFFALAIFIVYHTGSATASIAPFSLGMQQH